MKLVNPPRESSFYESFSDLIFSTLIIFIVLVMGLIIQLRASAETAQSQVSKVIFPNRFSGGSDETWMYTAHVPIAGETYVVWVPQFFDTALSLKRDPGGNDPILGLCSLWLGDSPYPDGVTAVSRTDFQKLAGGLSSELVGGTADSSAGQVRGGMIMSPLPGAVLHILRELAPAGTPRRAGGAMAMRDAIGGINLSLDNSFLASLPPNVAQRLVEYAGWYEMDGQRNRLAETKFELLPKLAGSKGQPPYVRFTALPDRRIRVGSLDMAAKDFRNLLRSIKPGRGFYVEHVDEAGAAVEPPEWVATEILDRVGVNGRVVNTEALKAASG